MLFGEHHESHAASAFYPSPFEQAAIVTMDGVGEWATSSIGVGRGNEIEMLRELRFPHSLGLLYSAFTYFTGFRVNSGEYKVMGLAPYGEPKYVKTIKDHLLEIRDDGSLWMNMEYFTYPHGLTMTGDGVRAAVRRPGAAAGSKLTQREMDLARSVQDITEEVMLKMAAFAHRETGMRDLCLAGGVALNCVGNGRHPARGPVRRDLDPAGGRRRRRRARRRARPLAPLSRQAARQRGASGTWERPSSGRRCVGAAAIRRRHERLVSRPRFTDDEIAAVPRRERLPGAPATTPATLADESPRCWRRRRSSACSRAAWSSARARSAAARSSATRGRRRCSR